MKLAVAAAASSRPRAAIAGLGTGGSVLAAIVVTALILRGPLSFGPWPSALPPPADGSLRTGPAGAAFVGARTATASAAGVPTPLRARGGAPAGPAGLIAPVTRPGRHPDRGVPGRDPASGGRVVEGGAGPGSPEASTTDGLRLDGLPVRIRAATRVLGADLSRTGQMVADALAPLSPSAGQAVGRAAAGAGGAVVRVGRAVAEMLGDVRRRPRTDAVTGAAPAPAARLLR